MPVRTFERRNVEDLAVRRDRHPVTASFVLAVPEQFLRRQIEGRHPFGCGDVDAAGCRTGGDALHVFSGRAGRDLERRNPFHELVPVVHVEHQEPHSAVLDLVTDTRGRNIEIMPLGLDGNERRVRRKAREGDQTQKSRRESQHVCAPCALVTTSTIVNSSPSSLHSAVTLPPDSIPR